mgnify:CR=1 FL=1
MTARKTLAVFIHTHANPVNSSSVLGILESYCDIKISQVFFIFAALLLKKLELQERG